MVSKRHADLADGLLSKRDGMTQVKRQAGGGAGTEGSGTGAGGALLPGSPVLGPGEDTTIAKTTTTTSTTTTAKPTTTSTTTTTTTTTPPAPTTTVPTTITTTTTPVETTTTPTTTRTTTTATTSPAPPPLAVPKTPTTTPTSSSPRVTVIVVSASSSSTTTASGTLANNSSNDSSSGPSTGAVVGIVAGALIAVCVVAALIGYLLKKRRSRDDDDDISPFERDEYRRGSTMLDDDYDAYGGTAGSMSGSQHDHDRAMYASGHSPQMSEYSMRELGRSNTLGSQVSNGALAAGALPGLARNGTLAEPRPPSGFVHHVAHQQHQQMMMPSFLPGQIMPAMPAATYGGANLAYAPTSASAHSHSGSGGAYGSGPYRAPNNDRVWQNMNGTNDRGYDQALLERNTSIGSTYSTRSELPGGVQYPAQAHSVDDHGNRLSLVREEREDDLSIPPVRSGTPTNSNVQQTFFSHRHEDSFDNGDVASVNPTLRGYDAWNGKSVSQMYSDQSASTTKRRLSVRNGGLDDYNDDGAYAGVH